jgi:microcystin-dependent protein
MSQPYIGEIKMVGFNFAPRSYAHCDGALQSIAENEALYSILGTTFGGNGQTSFGLPDLRGRVPIHVGPGTGGRISAVLGQAGGAESHALTTSELAAHTHPLVGSTKAADSANPIGNVLAVTSSKLYDAPGGMATTTTPLASAGGGQAHENRQPFIAVNFVIALYGIYPTRN